MTARHYMTAAWTFGIWRRLCWRWAACAEEASRVINGEKTQVVVRVLANFQAGSFEVSLELVQNVVQPLLSMLIRDDVTAAVNLAGLIGLTTGTAYP